MLVVADTTPLNYLILIRQIEVLRKLFGEVLIPPAVFAELQDPETPAAIRQWIEQRPAWLQIRPLHSPPSNLSFLDAGEQEAIALAEEVGADKILLDETEARREASRRKLSVVGTLGILREASRRQWLDLPAVLAALQQTTFYVSPDLIQSLLEEDRQWQQQKKQLSGKQKR